MFANDGARPAAPAHRAGAEALPAVGRPTGPYAKLAARGDFTGYVTTASGQEVYVNVVLGKKPASNEPIVMLDGIAARHERNAAFANGMGAMGQTFIQVYLTGQGETLVRDLQKGGKSLDHDISSEEQVKTVLETLDALGIKKKVSVAGLSYGGAIAADCRRLAPERFSKAMLVAPYIESAAKNEPMVKMMRNNPWNPFGESWYRSAAKSTLAKTFDYQPEVFKKHPGAFHEGLFRLTMGLEKFELKDAVKDQTDIHFLIVPEDGASSPEGNVLALKGVKTGSVLFAPEQDKGKHDLVRGDPAFVAAWMTTIMQGKIKATPVAGVAVPNE